ncbi:MAG: hypothetical protein M0R03_09150 [Novosphingobium sp.]|nr:hypothetical protein [Novosphingobium sp.]
MRAGAAAYRGQPLVALMLVLGGWAAMRAIVWGAAPDDAREFPVHVPAPAAQAAHPGENRPRGAVAVPAPAFPPPVAVAPANGAAEGGSALMAPVAVPPVPGVAFTPPPAPPPLPRGLSVAASSGHNLLWMAAVSRMPVFIAQAAEPAPEETVPEGTVIVPPVSGGVSVRVVRRWSADAWMLLRRGGGGGGVGTMNLSGASAPVSYGASQAGAIIRYRLSPQSAARPEAYLRVASALGNGRDREVSAGLSMRPVAAIPVSIGGELRARDEYDGVRARPSVLAVTELPYVDLPLGARLEAYGQAGYVGGRGKTAFADGQIHADRPVARLGQGELRAGGGIWGGAQKGAVRVDIGPSATVGLPVGSGGGARVAVDWRFRVSGNARPSSGPALTLSAGF